jgi:putative membrane-bound dehydrogenase-like protein
MCFAMRPSRGLLVLAVVCLPVQCGWRHAAAQGYAPEEAAAKMTVAEGFEVSLVAAEPLVRQPVCIEFDDQGRLWVVQYLQYPNPAGLQRVRVDRYSRTQYDRIPPPPPHGPRGADRITILLDANGDGRVEQARDFVSGLNLATGLAFGYGGVFVLNVPYLLFYPDRNRDDQPDADPEVLLEGFGMDDAHSVANSLTWGPDGWLYGCQGSTVTSRIRGIEFQQGVWRYHPPTRRFELFCEGGGNSWGLDFDAAGELLYSTNVGGYVMLHGEQGAYYWKSFGKHGALHNPFAYGYFDHVPHTGFTGGHVTCGGVVYQGTSFPAAFRGTYIAADLLGHAVHWHHLRRAGSSFCSEHGGTLLNANDTWFAPCDVTIGPDGAVYVADWHDQRTAHPDPDAPWDRSNGRIYRIQARGAPAVKLPNLLSCSNEELLAHIDDPNEWLARRARRLLAERLLPERTPPQPGLAPQPATGQHPTPPTPEPRQAEQALAADAQLPCVQRLRAVALHAEHAAALHALWVLAAAGGLDEEHALLLLDSPHPAVRAWTVRLLGDQAGPLSDLMARRLDRLAEAEPDVDVRSQLACTAARLPPLQALPVLNSLLLRDQDGADPHLPLLLWWGVERHAVADVQGVLRRFATSAAFENTLLRTVVLPRLMRRYAAEPHQDLLEACPRLLEAAPDRPSLRMLLASLDEGLAERGQGVEPPSGGSLFSNQSVPPDLPPSTLPKSPAAGNRRATPELPASQRPATHRDNAGDSAQDMPTDDSAPQQHSHAPVRMPAALLERIEREWRADVDDPLLVRLAVRCGLRPAVDHLLARVQDRQCPLPTRLALVQAAAAVLPTVESRPWLGLLAAEEPEAVQLAAVQVLRRAADEEVSAALLARYAELSPAVRAAVRKLLLARREFAARLLAAVDEGRLTAAEIPLDEVRLVALHGDQALDAAVRRHWGNVSAGTPEERLAEMRRLANELRAAGGDRAAGKAVFDKHCGKCHRLFGEGQQVGPDLTTANRQDRDYLLVSLVDPSAVIRREYLSHVVQTSDGRVLVGRIVSQTPATITLADAKGERITVLRDEVEAMEESPVSLMPDGLYRELAPQELRDLFAYLQAEP